MRTQSFLRGAAILTLAGLVSKLLGAGYRIPFFRVVGPEGMGLYQMAYPLYTMLLAVSSAGIPVAVSKLVAENLARRDLPGADRVFGVSLALIAVISGTGSILLYRSASFLAGQVLHDPRAYYSIAAIAPAVFLVGLVSVFRGYFQGFQEMFPTACSQVLEQFVRVITVLVGAYLCLPRGVEYAAAAATFGAVTGGAAAALFLLLLYIFRPGFKIGGFSSGRSGNAGGQRILTILHRVLALALPVSLAGLVVPVAQTIDALTVPGRLQMAGYSVSRAAQLYGELTGGALTLINLPAVLTVSLAASLVPAVAHAQEKRNYLELRRISETAVQITVLAGLPAAVGLMMLAVPVSDLLFDCPEAGHPLFFAAPAALLMGLHQTTAGLLQGMGRTMLPVANLIVGSVVKLAANWTLTTVPGIGIVGAAVGTVLGFLVSAMLNCLGVHKITGWVPGWRTLLLKPAVAVTIMAVVVQVVYSLSKPVAGNSPATAAAVAAGFLVYVALLIRLGIFRGLGLGGARRFLPWFWRRR